jgi:hypothetical protein
MAGLGSVAIGVAARQRNRDYDWPPAPFAVWRRSSGRTLVAITFIARAAVAPRAEDRPDE